jgi:DNA-binding MarR family transcriptional regulator
MSFTDFGEVDKEKLAMSKVNTAVMRSLKEFMEVNPSMPVSQAYVLTLVANNEGLSLVELSNLSGLRNATISRYLLDLSDRLRTGEDGYKLVTREIDPMELRRNMYTLAPKGRHLLKRVAGHFKHILKEDAIVDISRP